MLSTYIFNIEELTVWQKTFVKLLSDSERNSLRNIKTDSRLVNYTAGHALIKLLLLKKYHFPPFFLPLLTFNTNRWGKPFCHINDITTWHFNISHSTNFLAITLALQEVGVDIEEYNYALQDAKLLLPHFHKEETAQLASLPHKEQLRRIIKLWSAKEAVTKAYGRGLLTSLADFKLNGDILHLNRPQETFIHRRKFILLPANTTSYALNVAIGAEKAPQQELKIMTQADITQLMRNFSVSFV